MKLTLRLALLGLVALLGASSLMASGLVGVYGIVSKVVLEPNDKAPERIQIWGAFTLVEGGNGATRAPRTLTPQHGYMYFTLAGSPAEKEAALKEWSDFKAIAGTGQAVSFGRFAYIGAFDDELISRPAGNPPQVLMGGDPRNFNGSHTENPIRNEAAVPEKPSVYPVNMGLTKLARTGDLAAVVQKIEAALKK